MCIGKARARSKYNMRCAREVWFKVNILNQGLQCWSCWLLYSIIMLRLLRFDSEMRITGKPYRKPWTEVAIITTLGWQQFIGVCSLERTVANSITNT